MKIGVMMETVIKIRESDDSDLAGITEIYGRSVREETASFELTEPDQAELARRRKALLDAGYPYLVAEVEGRIVGYAYAGPYRSRPAYALSVENTVYVDPTGQRGGIGRALMESLITKAEKRGYRQMIAVIGGSEHIASIEFHKALGFREIGTIQSVGYKHGRWLDTVLLQLPLGHGNATPPDKIPGA